MKTILGLDIGSNSVGWAITDGKGDVLGSGARIIPSQNNEKETPAAQRTKDRQERKTLARKIKRRERFHRVLHLLDFLPEHYADAIDFKVRKGQWKNQDSIFPKLDVRELLPDKKIGKKKSIFLFEKEYREMVKEFHEKGHKTMRFRHSWTLYYLRDKALKEKISKHALAWVIMNFNQKRGYYQLRQEQKINEGNTYMPLEILNIKETKRKKKDKNGVFKKVYEVTTEKGTCTTTEQYETGTLQDFIVSCKENKKGEKTEKIEDVSANKWLSNKLKIEQKIKLSGRKISEIIYEELLKNPNLKIRGSKKKDGLVETIQRCFWKDEITEILKKQSEYHPELKDKKLFLKCIDELYPNDKHHRELLSHKNLIYLLTEDILYYQRPLKIKKSTISKCPYEQRVFPKDGKLVSESIRCMPKSHPLFQEFNLWQSIYNLRIKEKTDEYKITDVTKFILCDEKRYELLFDYCKNKRSITEAGLLSFFKKQGWIKTTKNYSWNLDKNMKGNETRYEFVRCFDKFKKICEERNVDIKDFSADIFLTSQTEYDLWHIVYSEKDPDAFKKALNTFASKHYLPKREFQKAFEHIKSYPSSNYASYSYKALKKIVPLMRVGKYWNENDISDEIKTRLEKIYTLLKGIDFNKKDIDLLRSSFKHISDIFDRLCPCSPFL
ncbi:MAG: hypothetical protein OXC03_03105 [Flavobacteriaceae bacterium]|nr:hypothetical protein [Flavobacteriaceae bacterium]